MSKIEDGTVHGTITHAKAGLCQDCGNSLNWKEPKGEGSATELLTAECCNHKYSITPSQYVVNEVMLPTKEEKELAKKAEKGLVPKDETELATKEDKEAWNKAFKEDQKKSTR